MGRVRWPGTELYVIVADTEITPDTAPFPFTGGTIEKVVVDVTGEKFVDHEKQVMAWFAKD